MTKAQMVATVKAIDSRFTIREKDGEIRVNWKGHSEEMAYYTNDRQDAVETAKSMAALRWSSEHPEGLPPSERK